MNIQIGEKETDNKITIYCKTEDKCFKRFFKIYELLKKMEKEN